MKTIFTALLSFAIQLIFLFPAKAQLIVGNTTLQIRTVATNLAVPWELVWGPDNYIWMTERYGRISRVDPGTGQVFPLVTISEVAQQNESGLLGMALHPNFTNQPHVFVAYTYLKNGSLTEKLVRYTYNGTALTTPLVILDNITAATNHDGSRLLILPDNTLLMTTGDAANTSVSQNPNHLSGKILRINLDGTVPANNPVAGSYVYSIGHRNPQGLTLASNGILYSSEHGPNNDDELNLITANRNYGWPNVEGFCNLPAEQTFCTANNVAEPLRAWSPTLAVAGIAYYNHPAIPEWQHSILMTTLKANKLIHLPLNTAGTAISTQADYFTGTYGRLRAICVSPTGKVYFSTSNKDGRAAPAATDDRIIELANLNFQPSGLVANSVNSIQIYPNPVTDLLKVNLQQAESATLEVLDLTGKTIFKTTADQSEITLNLSELKAATYLLKITSSKSVSFKKIVKNS